MVIMTILIMIIIITDDDDRQSSGSGPAAFCHCYGKTVTPPGPLQPQPQAAEPVTVVAGSQSGHGSRLGELGSGFNVARVQVPCRPHPCASAPASASQSESKPESSHSESESAEMMGSHTGVQRRTGRLSQQSISRTEPKAQLQVVDG
eukprot:864141-Rhodomonas_salina.1